jgi:hypothetical protein
MFYTPINDDNIQRLIKFKTVFYKRKLKKNKKKYKKIKRIFKGFILA